MKKIIIGMENRQDEKLLYSWIQLQKRNKKSNSEMFRNNYDNNDIIKGKNIEENLSKNVILIKNKLLISILI